MLGAQAFGRQVGRLSGPFDDLTPDVERWPARSSPLSAGYERLLQGSDLVGINAISGEMTPAEPWPARVRYMVEQLSAPRQHGKSAATGHHLADHARLQAGNLMSDDAAGRRVRHPGARRARRRVVRG